jgi:MFS family permease
MSKSIDQAERAVRRRAGAATALAVLFGATQWGSFHDEPPFNRPEAIHAFAWVVWAIALCAFLAFGGGLFGDRSVRAQLNDESTREHRRQALALGFWGAMGTALAVYGLSYVSEITVREAVRLVITLAIMLALLRFGFLERRALKDD